MTLTQLRGDTVYPRADLEDFIQAYGPAPVHAYLAQAYGETPVVGVTPCLNPKHEGFIPYMKSRGRHDPFRARMSPEELVEYIVKTAYPHALADAVKAATESESVARAPAKGPVAKPAPKSPKTPTPQLPLLTEPKPPPVQASPPQDHAVLPLEQFEEIMSLLREIKAGQERTEAAVQQGFVSNHERFDQLSSLGTELMAGIDPMIEAVRGDLVALRGVFVDPKGLPFQRQSHAANHEAFALLAEFARGEEAASYVHDIFAHPLEEQPDDGDGGTSGNP